MKLCGGIAPRILNVGIRRSEWSASRPNRFIAGERTVRTDWMEGW
jgi:hypothetical protein